MLNILVVEDNIDLCALVVAELEREKYAVSFANDGEEAIALFCEKRFDLIITDILLPKVNGLEFISFVRREDKNIPILIISANSTQADKYKGFDAGTDDYMVKPIDIDELLMRVRALLRRAKIMHDKKLTIGGAVLDYDTYSVTIDQKTTVLPQKEFLILFKLLSYPDSFFTKNQLMEEFWDINSDSDDITVYTHIHRLREKYQDCPYFEIVSIRNLGYKAVLK